MYKSEIRLSQVNALLEKVKKHNYAKYLIKLNIQKIRGFSDKEVTFDFPVTALIGPNGSGKSSILGAAGCAYKAIRPSLFFPKSTVGDESMSGWGVAYELLDTTVNKQNPKNVLRRTSSFKKAKWVRGDLVDRYTLFFGIERTVPTGEKSQFKQLTRSTYTHNKDLTNLDAQVIKQVGHILGKNFDEYKMTPYGTSDKFFVGNNQGVSYSEFHFGAGESSIIRMIDQIEQAPNHSLILIEEIENGLHPIATARMVEYLIDVAERKSIQTIFTTHSDYALLPLPNEAIWACVDGKLHQGKLSVESLRAISGRVDKKLAIFVEDDFAKSWIEEILRKFLTDRFQEIEVHAVAGDGNAVRIHRSHLENPAISSKSLCIIDGDSQQIDDISKQIFRLPGKQPEREIFNVVYQHLGQDILKLAVACQFSVNEQNNFKNVLDKVNSENRDAHLLFSQIGENMQLKPEQIIRGAFLTYWMEYNKQYCQELSETIKNILDNNVDESQ